MTTSLLMLDLVRIVYWFDEHLQRELGQRGWGAINRSQSLVLANIANGETRAARIAENIGVSRQAMSQLLADLIARDIVELADDPGDKRARILQFTDQSHQLRKDAIEILATLEQRIAAVTSIEDVAQMKQVLSSFLRAEKAI